MSLIKGKIKNLSELASITQSLKSEGKKIVHCHGVFDLLHVGHVRHFQEAKNFGDILVVTLTPDKFVNKGPHRPAFQQDLRAEVLAALDFVDFVAINEWPTAIETIKLLKPNVYAKGPDYKDSKKDLTGKIKDEHEAVKSVGGVLSCTEDITFSSSNLVNRFFPSFPTEVTQFLDSFKQKYKSDQIIGFLESLKSMKVLVVGEAILDEYVYCEALGKSSKEPILAMKYLSQDTHAGGSLAIANHISSFCKEVGLVTYLGQKNPQEEFIRKNLRQNINPTFIYKKEAPTIVKRRFLDQYLLTKTFEIYEIDDENLNEEEDKIFCSELENQIPNYDLVIVADFGHGLITSKAREILCEKSKFLAVNTQINAANIGYHTISKYPRADYISIHEGEVRQDGRNRKGDLKELVVKLAERTKCKTVMITRGKHGSFLYRSGSGFHNCPSMAIKVVDRIGAGDAVLGITSMCVTQDIPPDVVNMVGNLVGAQAVTIVGNSASIDKVQLYKTIESVLK